MESHKSDNPLHPKLLNNKYFQAITQSSMCNSSDINSVCMVSILQQSKITFLAKRSCNSKLYQKLLYIRISVGTTQDGQ